MTDNKPTRLHHITVFKKSWILPQVQNIEVPDTESGVNNYAESSGGFGS